METESEHRSDGECRNLTALKHIKTTVRNFSHELSQPLMVIQGHLELLEHGQVRADAESLNHVLENIAGQMDTIRELLGRLKAAIQPSSRKFSETEEGRKHDTDI